MMVARHTRGAGVRKPSQKLSIVRSGRSQAQFAGITQTVKTGSTKSSEILS
jgi:hypothetical protein